MRKILKSLCVILISISLLGANMVFAQDNTAKVFVIGDSTAASYAADRYPLTGWAQVLQMYFSGNITVDNRAQSGASSKSFYNTYWSNVIDDVVAGDYVVIQFGHNDSKTTTSEEDNVTVPDPNRYTDPLGSSTTEGSYKWYLTKFIDEVKVKGATPILTTSIERRSISGGVFQYTLISYANSMRDLGVEKNIQVIDLNEKTYKFYTKLGVEGTKDIFLILDAGESVNYPNGITDNTHLQENGAKEIAKLFAIEILKSNYDLKNSVIPIEYEEEEIVTPNFIINGGFENVTAGVPAGWIDQTGGNWAGGAQIVSDGAIEGNNSYKIISTAALQYIQQNITGLTVGQRYKLSFKFKCTTSSAVLPVIKFQHKPGSYFDNFESRVFATSVKGEWTNYTCYIIAPAVGTELMVRTSSGNNHNIFYDDMKLEPEYSFASFYKTYDKRVTTDQTKNTDNPYQTELVYGEKGVPISTVAEGTIKVRYHYISDKTEAENVTLLAVLYKTDGTNKKYVTMAPQVTGTASVTSPLDIVSDMTIPALEEGASYKIEVFLWDSLAGMVPLDKNVSFQ